MVQNRKREAKQNYLKAIFLCNSSKTLDRFDPKKPEKNKKQQAADERACLQTMEKI